MTGATVPVAAGLVVLAVLDGSLAGFRAVCGRSAMIDRRSLERRASIGGAAGAALAASVLGAWFAGVLVAAEHPAERLEDLTGAGARALAVYATLAALAAAALVGYLLAPLRWRSLSMVTTLGPLTLARPSVLVAGAWAAAWGSPSATVWASAAVVVAVIAVEGHLVDRWVRAEVHRSASSFERRSVTRPAPTQ